MAAKKKGKHLLLAVAIFCLVVALVFMAFYQKTFGTEAVSVKAFKIVSELLFAFILTAVVRTLVQIVIRDFGTNEMITEFLGSVIICILFFNMTFNSLVVLGVNPKALKSISSVTALMVGIGSKKIIANLLAGVFIEVEDLIHPFDFIIIKKYAGLVVDKNLFYVTLEDGDENRKKIKSKDFVNFNNASFNLSTINIDAKVSVKVPFKEIEAIVKAVLENPEEKYPSFVDKPEFQGIEKFSDGKMHLRFTGRCKGKDRKKSMVSLTSQIATQFKKNGIGILLPQMEVIRGVRRT
ncbi:mechanosensitive ion channel family protein [Clostridium sp. YIM B02505]|uniref:Mechanosensitive ion channel family protein n=1 Tax=Clostridium yunnanense TaxID=2800325 RepID=A0ABS1EV16_9CLOT|nr:mechanosensitive ion channel domain-containing protein [Clostridium yunnanense]MBK1813138.1 mechanosensitive ion channel family protein [Clostridium yunnanense]